MKTKKRQVFTVKDLTLCVPFQPRRINRIADLSLLVGYADSMSTIGPRDVESVADEIGLSIGG